MTSATASGKTESTDAKDTKSSVTTVVKLVYGDMKEFKTLPNTYFDGWKDEPVSAFLTKFTSNLYADYRVAAEDASNLFSDIDREQSVMAFDGDKPIGQCAGRSLKMHELKVLDMLALKPMNPFLRLQYLAVGTCGAYCSVVLPHVSRDKFSINTGLMVLPGYRSNGVAKELVKERLKRAKSKGFLYSFACTTSDQSKAVMTKNGGKLIKEMTYRKIDVNFFPNTLEKGFPLDGSFCIFLFTL